MPVKFDTELPRVAGRLDRRARQAVEKQTSLLAQDMRRRVPVATGATRRSIRPVAYQDGGAVLADFPWFLIEHGTARMAAQPFVGPAVAAARPSFAVRAAQILKP